jgi:hypothetical protein
MKTMRVVAGKQLVGSATLTGLDCPVELPQSSRLAARGGPQDRAKRTHRSPGIGIRKGDS